MTLDSNPASRATQAAPPAPSVTHPERFFLQRLISDDPARFAAAWLELQAQRLTAVEEAILLLRSGDVLVPAATLPADLPPGDGLRSCAEAVLARKTDLARERDGRLEVGCLVRAGDRVVGVAALALSGPMEAAEVLRALHWGAGWIRAWQADRDREAAAPGLDRARKAFEILNGALEPDRFGAAARRVVTELAHLSRCDRVSVGFRRWSESRVAAVSHSAHFGRRMNMIRLLAGAMDEAIDQQATILFPAPEGAPSYGDRAHQQLAREAAAGQVLTVPVLSGDSYRGALVFERPATDPFVQEDIDFLTSLALFAGPVLDERRRNDRWLIVKAGESFGHLVRRIAGPGNLVTKLVLAALVMLVAAGWLAEGAYRVTGDAKLEGSIQRSIIAPFDGFIADAAYTAGDRVEKGAVVARLDDRDLSLERLNWVAERQRHTLEYEQALGAHDRAQQNIARAQIEQAEAQVKLIEERLDRSSLRAPFAGILVSGDLSQSIGAAVSRGQTLFEIAPLESYRVIVWVDDREIEEVFPDQKGELVLSALPNRILPVTVTQITPVASVRDGVNAFRVVARIDGDVGAGEEALRPGMEGVAKFDVGRRRLVSIWTGSLVDWWRLALWRWFG